MDYEYEYGDNEPDVRECPGCEDGDIASHAVFCEYAEWRVSA